MTEPFERILQNQGYTPQEKYASKCNTYRATKDGKSHIVKMTSELDPKGTNWQIKNELKANTYLKGLDNVLTFGESFTDTLDWLGGELKVNAIVRPYIEAEEISRLQASDLATKESIRETLHSIHKRGIGGIDYMSTFATLRNILVTPENKLYFIDFGHCKSADENMDFPFSNVKDDDFIRLNHILR